MKVLRLKDSLATSLASGHPWVYRDHVGKFTAPSGSWVQVECASYRAVGLWDADSAIALRLFSSGAPVDATWVSERVREAWALRAPLREAGVSGYRLIFGEGDQLPGIVVDLYGSTAVLVTYSSSLGALVPWVAQAVQLVAGSLSVVRRHRDARRGQLEVLCGEMPASVTQIEENGMLMEADLIAGQKTGLFFDHRDNRLFVRQRVKGCSVLNLFAYTGGFSLAAGIGGASEVTSVDISAAAIQACERNFVLNGCSLPHRAVVADVFDFLEQEGNKGRLYDWVICDPPSFAKNRAALPQAEKAYRKLMALALAVVRPGGFLCAASCTSQVGPSAFRRALMDAARKARRRLSVTHDIGHPLDHPVAIGHEEGRYLKFVVGRVQARC